MKYVHFLKTDPKARWQGYLFFFNEGFCWTNVLMPTNEESKYIKCRLKDKSINDVASMSLYNKQANINNSYLVAILNSRFMYDYLKEFINNTVNLQINDFRQLPIVIPDQEKLLQLTTITQQAKNIKINQHKKNISEMVANIELNTIQQNLESIVNKLYFQ